MNAHVPPTCQPNPCAHLCLHVRVILKYWMYFGKCAYVGSSRWGLQPSVSVGRRELTGLLAALPTFRTVQRGRLHPLRPAPGGGARHQTAQRHHPGGGGRTHHRQVRQLAQLQQERAAHRRHGSLPVTCSEVRGPNPPPSNSLQVGHCSQWPAY